MAISRSGDSNSAPRSRSVEPSRFQQRSRIARPSRPAQPERIRQRVSKDSSGEATVHSLQPQQKPWWLMVLLRFQQTASLMTLLLAAGVLITYGWTVYIQQRWGQQYDRLETLKKQERQLISANEVLKNQMADQAENPKSGLLLPDPSNAIFLTPAPQRPEVKPTTVPSTEPSPTRPLGY